MKKSKIFGSVLIVAGTTFGAGMLALPMVTAPVNFWFICALLIGMCILMIYTAFLILEVNLAFEERRNNFITMASNTLGTPGKIVCWVGFLMLLYSLTAAYIAGDASLLSTIMRTSFSIYLPSWIYATLFTLVFGFFVYLSTNVVDVVNRGLIGIKTALLLITLILLMPYVDVSKLNNDKEHISYIWASVPIILCSFGFHHIIPSLTNYVGRDYKALKKIIIYGISAPLIIYLIWLFITLSIVPLYGQDSFYVLGKTEGSVGKFISFIILITKSRAIKIFINGFSNIAMTTSFLGVTLGLFDFLADGFKRLNTKVGRFQTSILTFIPPLIFAIFYPKGFIFALGYAGAFVAILEIILPALMVMKLRKSDFLNSPYRVNGSKIFLFIAIFVGIVIVFLQIANNLKLLPVFP